MHPWIYALLVKLDWMYFTDNNPTEVSFSDCYNFKYKQKIFVYIVVTSMQAKSKSHFTSDYKRITVKSVAFIQKGCTDNQTGNIVWASGYA